MPLQGTLRARGGTQEPWQTCGAVLVRPDAVHEVDARGDAVLIGFFDAVTELGVALCDRIQGEIGAVAPSEVSGWRDALAPPISEASLQRWVSGLLGHCRRAPAIDPRIERVLSHVRAHLGGADDLSLSKLAAVAGLSRSRFMHVFTAAVGVPLRPYVRWLRLQRAACELMAGTSVSMAAHGAGFADAAHLTRTFRRMLGLTPSDLALRGRVAQGIAIPPA